MPSVKYPYLIIGLIGALLFIPFLGQVHLFDWDEINFAESAREMMETHNYMQVQINYQPFWEKPPLFFWMQVLSMNIFGVNEFAARLPNAICGIVLLGVLFHIGKKLHSERFGWLMTLIYAGSFLPHFYFKTGIIDPWFNLFIFLGIYQLVLGISSHEAKQSPGKHILFAGLFTGLAVLTKGPVGLLIPLLSYFIYVLFRRKRALLPIKYYLQFALMVLLTALIWFGLEIKQHGWWFINEFITYQIRLFKTHDAGHAGFPGYHFVVLFIGVFPASILIYRWKKNIGETLEQANFRLFALISFWVVLVLFSLVQTKIIHYSSFCYLPMCYLAAYSFEGIITGTYKIKSWQKYSFLIIGLVWFLITSGLPIIGMHPEWLQGILKDPFALENLQAEVSWNYLLCIPGIAYGIIVVIAFVWMQQKKYQKALITYFVSTIVFIQVILLLFIPRIELYSQNAAIEFFKSLQGKDCYVVTLGYKSYANYFYTLKKPGERKEALDHQWLLREAVDKPTYFVCKSTMASEISNEYNPFVEEIYRKNGYVFFKRK